MGAADPAFAAQLVRSPAAAARAGGVDLSLAEQRTLAAVAPAALASMVQRMDTRLTRAPADRRAFLGRAAAALATLAGGAGLGAGCDRPAPTARPAPQDKPAPRESTKPAPPRPAGITAEARVGEGTIGLATMGTITGSRPDNPAGAPTLTRVRVGPATVDRGLRPAVVRRIVRRHLNHVRYCHDRQPAQDRSAARELELVCVIGADGKVIQARAAQGPRALARCVEHAVHRWRFPRPRGGGRVKVALRFYFELSRPAATGAR